MEVTLDVAPEFHDARRISKGRGSPTFWKIFNNLVAVCGIEDLGLQVGLRCNVDRRNKDGVQPLIDLLVKQGMQNKLEKFYVAPVHPWGNDVTGAADPAEFASWRIHWFAELARLGFKVGLISARTTVVHGGQAGVGIGGRLRQPVKLHRGQLCALI